MGSLQTSRTSMWRRCAARVATATVTSSRRMVQLKSVVPFSFASIRPSAQRGTARWCSSNVTFPEMTPEEAEEVDSGVVDWVEVLETYKAVEELPWNNDVGSDMVVGLGVMKKLDEAEEAFRLTLEKQVDRPNTYLLNSMLTAANRCQQPQKVLEYFEMHVDSTSGLQLKANRDTYRAVLVACGKMGAAEMALNIFSRMQDVGFKPELQSINAVLRAQGDDQTSKPQLVELMAKHSIRGNAETERYLKG